MASTQADEAFLDALLQKVKTQKDSPLLLDDLSHLIMAFLPSRSATLHSKAYLVLSALCQAFRSPHPKQEKSLPATDCLVNIFSPALLPRVAHADATVSLAGISFFIALFQVDAEVASALFIQDGVLESVLVVIDISPSDDMLLHVAQLLSQVCGYKRSRSIVNSLTLEWLESSARQEKNATLRAAAVVALIKHSQGSSDTEYDLENQLGRRDEEFVTLMKDIVKSGRKDSSVAEAVEGLAYLSTHSVVKEDLSQDAKFLTALFSFIPLRKSSPLDPFIEHNPTIIYGVIVIISQLCAYRPQLTEEQSQIEKLKRMTKAGKKRDDDRLSAFDDDDHVKFRIRQLIAAGALGVLTATTVITNASDRIRPLIGKTLLSISEERENRGKVLQSGGAKALSTIIKQATSSSSSGGVALTVLDAIQALAKLAITSSPIQVFGPGEGALYDAIRPFSVLLQHASSTLLQQFEAMMALTNLASQSSEVASRIAQVDGLMTKVEFLMLEEHQLVRRAATELICNLIAGSDDVFNRYSGNTNATSKVEILLALSDVEDVPTRLAASGALATLTSSTSVCQILTTLQLERHKVWPILTLLINPLMEDNEQQLLDVNTYLGLIHRGVICVRNIARYIQEAKLQGGIVVEAERAGLAQALRKVMESQAPSHVLQPATESLDVFKL